MTLRSFLAEALDDGRWIATFILGGISGGLIVAAILVPLLVDMERAKRIVGQLFHLSP